MTKKNTFTNKLYLLIILLFNSLDYRASYQCFKDTNDDYDACTDAIKPFYEQWKVAHPKDDPQITLKCL